MVDSGEKYKNYCLENCYIDSRYELLHKIDKQNFIFCNLYCKFFKNEIIKNNNLRLDGRMLSSNWKNYTMLANADVISAGNTISPIPCLTSG